MLGIDYMPPRNPLTAAPPFEVEVSLKALGANIRTARLRRGLSAEVVAQKIGVTRQTVADAERGKPTTAIAVYAGLLWALGLVGQLAEVASPLTDEEGRALAMQHEPKRARSREVLDNDF